MESPLTNNYFSQLREFESQPGQVASDLGLCEGFYLVGVFLHN